MSSFKIKDRVFGEVSCGCDWAFWEAVFNIPYCGADIECSKCKCEMPEVGWDKIASGEWWITHSFKSKALDND